MSKRANAQRQTVDIDLGVARFGLSDPAPKAGPAQTAVGQALHKAGALAWDVYDGTEFIP